MVALVGVAGCEADNSLGGSVGEVYELSFQTVEARLFESEFAVEYIREDEQIPVRVIVERREGSEISQGEISLDNRGTVVGRVGPRRLPRFKSGRLQLDRFRPEQGAPVEGSFESRLQAEDSEFSIRGTFSTRLDVVDGSIGYPQPDAGDAGDAGDVGDVGEVGGRDVDRRDAKDGEGGAAEGGR